MRVIINLIRCSLSITSLLIKSEDFQNPQFLPEITKICKNKHLSVNVTIQYKTLFKIPRIFFSEILKLKGSTYSPFKGRISTLKLSRIIVLFFIQTIKQ